MTDDPNYQRIDKLVRDMLESLEETFGPDWRIDDFGVTAAIVYHNEDDDEGIDREQTVSFFSTKRRYIQYGLIAAAYERAKAWVS